jgi:hypothetical protein
MGKDNSPNAIVAAAPDSVWDKLAALHVERVK